MNDQTFQVLEFIKIKEEIKEITMTQEGKTFIDNMQPSYNLKQIEAWLDEVEEAKRILAISSSVPVSGLDGMESIRNGLHKGVALRVDQLMKIMLFLDSCEKMKRFMIDKEYVAPRVSTYVAGIEDLSSLAEEITRCIRNNRIDDYASKELLRLRKQIGIVEDRLKEKAEAMVRSKKIESFLQDSMVVIRNGRYTIPVKKEYKSKVKGSVLDVSASGSTLFIEPEELMYFQAELEGLKSLEVMEEERILSYLTGLVEEQDMKIKLAMDIMVTYDVLFAKAKYALRIKANKVQINDRHYIELKNARHPLLGDKAFPLNLVLGEGTNALLITGPNTGGKTVTIKTVGLLALMIQCGLHVPADLDSQISIYQRILLDIGDGQSIEQNLSTFSSHLKNIISVLTETNDHSLVLLDELGSGTDPREGMGLATAILEELFKKGCTLLATTHYSEIKEFAESTEGFINGSMEFDLETLQPTYRLLLGEGGSSQAFAIALKLGMHPTIIQNAHSYTYKEDKNYDYSIYGHDIKELEKQLARNKFAHFRKQEKKVPLIEQFHMGDNVLITATGEFGIIYKGPDEMGQYIVQVKNEKREYPYKRLKLYIKASEMYPEDYDFDIIFQSKDYRKSNKQLSKGHVEGMTIERE
ncbi:endonuclease MutS2 [Peribacillus alkalitolerans]|uniref:endonuclease MutS2 n=1 Tax=Peribacillus alkalitolerans TaxID=1550385 RepID=UPI0013D3BCAF|nr:endonuclease MutS2 [Peribacillus alkalitolerans]